jgi:hypothetical protein
MVRDKDRKIGLPKEGISERAKGIGVSLLDKNAVRSASYYV